MPGERCQASCNLQLHSWLEATAYFKMPKGQEQELVALKRSSLEKVHAHFCSTQHCSCSQCGCLAANIPLEAGAGH